ncbi:hypothetical protein L6164_008450 [Bauhinia variegata]|uniref:Uncharacterized protein n=1 Tax=Bauhinia variegata TaxID=167791 RepID=A0ACB9PGR4_BAUVA|nr:hypothetical protein L6164_008450 [Bauhinia variegata]
MKREEWELSGRMEWCKQMMRPIRRVWFRVSTRLGVRKSGLLKLRRDVRACEYEDIHVMWEIVKRNVTEFGESPRKIKKRRHYLKWARCTPYICRSY